MPRFYVTVGPQSRTEHPFAPAPTWVVDAADEDAASHTAETLDRLSNPDVEPIRLRLTPASAPDR